MIKSYNKKLNAVINSFALLSISFPPILVLKLTSNLCALETAAILMTQELDDFLKIAHNLEGLNILAWNMKFGGTFTITKLSLSCKYISNSCGIPCFVVGLQGTGWKSKPENSVVAPASTKPDSFATWLQNESEDSNDRNN
jgi:hypothetical protein